MSLNLETLEKSIKVSEQSINVYYIYKEKKKNDINTA